MPKSCCVTHCTNNSAKNSDIPFCLLPTKGERRQQWLVALRRAMVIDGQPVKNKLWSPSCTYTYVCGKHFITGKKVNDSQHPDYVPSLFPERPSTDTQTSLKLDRYKRAANRSHTDPPAKKRLRLDNCEGVDEVVTDCLASPLPLPVPEMPTPMQKPVDPSEREQLYAEIDNLRKERDEGLKVIEKLKGLLDQTSFSSSSVQNDDKKCKFMIGVSWGMFMSLFTFLSSFLGPKHKTKDSLPFQEQLYLTLVKLRHDLPFELIAQIRGVPKTTVIDYFWKCIDLLYAKIGFMVNFQDRDNIFRTIPTVFKAKFPRLTSIIDCFEIFMEAPRNLKARAQCYSNYKKHCTVKVFISCSPLGHVNYLSPCWGGRATDVKMVRTSDFISHKYHMPGDQILADRGFLLHDDFSTQCSATLLTPAFTKGKKQLSAQEVETSRIISSVRIHIERVIGLLKNRFTILQGTMPVRSVKSLKCEGDNAVLASCDKIISVCAALVNLAESIVDKVH